ncbi:MAG: type IV pilus modification PilV family protein [Pirellulales bacterium]
MRYTRVQLEDRNGITLMEVLIAIGILAIGLSSVAALMPAAGSQAKKAVVADRASSMAENALADAVTVGLTKPSSLVLLRDPGFGGPVSLPSSTFAICNWNRIVIDPLSDPELSEDLNNDLILNSNEDDGVDDDADGYLDGLIYAGLERDGIFSGGGAASNDVLKLFSQGRDDLVYEEPASADALPTNQIDNTRAFLGRTSCLWALESLNGGPIAAQNTARLSAVLFHERDPSDTTFTATINDAGLISWTSLPAGRSIKQVFRRGVVVVRMNPNAPEAPSMYVLRAAPAASTTSVYAMADDSRLLPASGTTDEVRILLDSVGLAQKIVTLEGNSEYTLSDERKVTP